MAKKDSSDEDSDDSSEEDSDAVEEEKPAPKKKAAKIEEESDDSDSDDDEDEDDEDEESDKIEEEETAPKTDLQKDVQAEFISLQKEAATAPAPAQAAPAGAHGFTPQVDSRTGMSYYEAFVGNISFEATEDALYELFGACGDLINIKLLRGKAFAKFSSGEALGRALALHGTESEGRRIKVEEAGASKPATERDPNSTTVFVGGISYYSNEERIAEHFKDCGEIKDVRMPLNEEGTQVRRHRLINVYLEPRLLPSGVHVP